LNIVVNVSDARASAAADDTLVTYALGSCIGVALYDSVSRVAGLLHFQLPTSTLDAKKAAENPMMFADTGMNHLVSLMERSGAQKQRIKVKLAGGAEMLNDAKLFSIGRRNHAAIRKVLWQAGMLIEAEDVGGGSPRTMYVRPANGEVRVKTQAQEKVL